MDKRKTNRIWELDFLRGFSIIMMVFDHTMYDLKNLPAWFGNYYSINNDVVQAAVKFANNYWNSDLRAVGHWVFVGFFLLVSGISFTFSRNNFKRALKFLLFAILISVITFAGEALSGLNIAIFFGIIHMFAVSTLITLILRKIWNNDLFILILGISAVAYGIWFGWQSVPYLAELTFANFWMVIVGIRGYGADFFGIFPYVGVIMIGTVIGNTLYKNRMSLLPHLDGKWNLPFVFTGTHSLAVFILHQPIVFDLIAVIAMLLGYRF